MKEKFTTKLEKETRSKLRTIAAENGLKYENQAIEFLVNKWYESKEGKKYGMEDTRE